MKHLRWEVEGADWPLRAHSRFVRSAGLDWHVQRTGTGPPILLLHGTGASTHSWRDVAPLLAEQFTVMSVDLPGHGFTRGHLPGGLTLPLVAGALRQLLDQEGYAPAGLVGHSAGAAIALELGSAPVIAFAPALRPMGGPAAPLFSGAARLLLANPLTSFFAAGASRHFIGTRQFLERSTGSRIDARGVALYDRLFGSPGHVEGALSLMANWNLSDLAARLPALPHRIDIVHGARDTAIPPAESREVARLTGCALTILPELGHLAHEERPDEAARLIVAAMGERV